MYQKNNWETTILLDKNRKKDYTRSNQARLQLGAFDDDAVADSAVNYLYDKGNQSKTQSFLKNNGFPSAQDRAFNKQLYGAQEEQRQMRDLLKNRTYTIMTPKLPNENDRAFLHGLMGEKEGERDYQKQITDANRAQSDLLSAFRGTQFESSLKPSVPKREALPGIKLETSDTPDVSNDLSHTADLDDTKYVSPKYSDSRTVASTSKNIAYSANNTANQTKTRASGYVQARHAALAHGGNIEWNDSTKKATVTINGITKDYYVGDGLGTFIDATNNKMWIHDSALYRAHNINLGVYGPTRYQNLSQEAKMLIATVAGEAIGENEDSRKAVTNAIINRVFSNRHYGNSIATIVSTPGQFSSFEGDEYNKAMNYLNNRNYTNSTYEKLIEQVMDVYCGYEYDITHGSTLFYSPKSMNPVYSQPVWNFSELQEVYVSPDIDKKTFKFYKYK